jgi:hypothetical protein
LTMRDGIELSATMVQRVTNSMSNRYLPLTVLR